MPDIFEEANFVHPSQSQGGERLTDMPLEEEKAILQLANGNASDTSRKAFGRLFASYMVYLPRYVETIMRRNGVENKRDPGDIINDTYLKIQRILDLGKFQIDLGLTPILETTIGRLILDLRKRKSTSEIPFCTTISPEDTSGVLFLRDESLMCTSTPLDLCIEQEGHKLTFPELQPHILQLTPEQQEVILMYFRDKLPLEEIARKLNKPVGTIKARWRRGKIRLREMLERDKKRFCDLI